MAEHMLIPAAIKAIGAERKMSMWNSIKSVKLSTIFTKVVMVLVVAFAIALPVIKSEAPLAEQFMLSSNEINYAMVIIYICCVFALIALFSLDQLLFNIKVGKVFIYKNVAILRRISWCCFIAALVLIPGAFFSLVFLLLAVMSGFMGLILRVVKNVFEAAVALKAENDFTI